MGGGRGEQHEHAAIDPVVQRHAEHRQKAQAQARRLGGTGAATAPRRRRRRAGLPPPARYSAARTARARTARRRLRRCRSDRAARRGFGPRAARSAASRRMAAAGSAKPRAAHLTYCTRLEPNRTPTGMAANTSASASAQVSGRKRRNTANDQERQQQHEREIAEIGLAEDEVLDGAQVAQARREVEHLLAALERAGDVAGEELAEHRARHAVVDQAVVAAVERPHAAEKARIVEEDDRERDRDPARAAATSRRGRTRTSSPSTAAAASSGQRRLHPAAAAGSLALGSSRMASGGACLIATPKMRRPTSSGASVRHCIVACVIGANRSPAPSHKTSPCQHKRTADEIGGKAVHDEPRHRELPALQNARERRSRDRAIEVADLRIPVVAPLVDEPEAKPYRVGEIDVAHAPRKGRAVQDPVGGKGIRACRERTGRASSRPWRDRSAAPADTWRRTRLP